jgi:hypothetical protein
MVTRRRSKTVGRLPSGWVLLWIWVWGIGTLLAWMLAGGPQVMAVNL